MRTREQLEQEGHQDVELEVLLDIRDLLMEQVGATAKASGIRCHQTKRRAAPKGKTDEP